MPPLSFVAIKHKDIMRVEELRIGNYYSVIDKNGVNVKQIAYLILSNGEWFSDGDNLTLFADSIPLTEEWLMKFGFKKTMEYDRNIFRLKKFLVVGGNLFYFQHVQILHVHHLQNLYFALTGIDLTIVRDHD